MKDGASSDRASDPHRRAAFLRNLEAEPESKPISSDTLRCVERLEYPAEDFGVHADAGIGDGQPDAGFPCPVVLELPDTEDQTASVRHGVQGVAYEVGDDLPQFPLRPMDEDAGRQCRFHGHIGGGNPPSKQVEGLFQRAQPGRTRYCLPGLDRNEAYSLQSPKRG